MATRFCGIPLLLCSKYKFHGFSELSNSQEICIWLFRIPFNNLSGQNVLLCINHASSLCFRCYFLPFLKIRKELSMTGTARPSTPGIAAVNDYCIPNGTGVSSEWIFTNNWSERLNVPCDSRVRTRKRERIALLRGISNVIVCFACTRESKNVTRTSRISNSFTRKSFVARKWIAGR